MPLATKSYANQNKAAAFGPHSFQRRDPGPNDVAISIEFCGICHSDIHTARGEWGEVSYPCVPGHEIIGTVHGAGENVTKFTVGQRVGVGCMVGSCGTCQSCKDGDEQHCDSGQTCWTYNSPVLAPQTEEDPYTKGGYSDHIVVDQSFVLSVPENLDPAAAAPLLCAGITTFSPLRRLGIGKGSKVGVLGLGGLGHMAVKLAASMGAEVTVLSRSPQKKTDAKMLGASQFCLTTSSEECTGLAGTLDCIIDTVSAPHDLDQAASFLKKDGTLVLVGASDKPLEFGAFSVIGGRKKIMGSLIGGIAETQEMLDHCGRHAITSEIEVISPAEINTAYERMLKSDVKYRFVIDCSKF